MMTIEEYRAAILQCLLHAKKRSGTPAITPKEAQEALTVLPITNCRMESFGIHQKTWLK